MNLNGSGRFKLISKDKAKELINNDTNTSLKDTKKKGK
jgi:hypothetical protein